MKSDALFAARIVLAMSAAIGLTASCSSATSGTPEMDGVRTSPGGVTSSSGPPVQYTVEEPLDVHHFLDDPCGLVSVDLLKSLDVAPASGKPKLPDGDVVAAEVGPYCSWPEAEHINLSSGIQSGNTERGLGGLDGIYAMYERGRYSYWEETSSSGYPAAYTGLKDRRGEGSCELVVGVADDMTFSVMVDVYSGDPQDACGIVDEVAADVIQNLQEAN